MNQQIPQHQAIYPSEQISLKEILGLFIRRWYLFAIGLVIALPTGFFYAKSLVSSHEVKGKMLMSNKSRDNRRTKEILEDFGYFRPAEGIEDKIEILTSHSSVQRAVKKIPWQVAYYEDHLLGASRIAPWFVPFQIKVDSTSPQLVNVPIYVKRVNKGQFKFWVDVEEADLEDPMTGERVRKVGNVQFEITNEKLSSVVKNEYISLSVMTDPLNKVEENKTYIIKIRSLGKLVSDFKEGLTVETVSEESNVIDLYMSSPVPTEAERFLNTLMQSHIDFDLEKRKQEGEKTLSFIDQQLSEVAMQLRNAEDELAGYQVSSSVVNVDASAEVLNQQLLTQQQRQSELEVKLRYYRSIKQRLIQNESNGRIPVPSTNSIADPLLKNLLVQLTDLADERSTYEFSVTENNSNLDRINLKIQRVKESLLDNLDNGIATLETEIEAVNDQIQGIYGNLSMLPGRGKRLNQLDRNYESVNKTYNVLMEKRVEGAISLSNLSSDYQVIDAAQSTGNVSGLSTGLVMIIALMLGLGLPAGITLVLNFLDDRLRTYHDVKRATPIPLLGTIIKSKLPSKVIDGDSADSPLGECFRALRVHIYKQLGTLGVPRDQGVLIAITSTWSGEGKSFTSANLASSFGLAGYKILLIDLDMRNSSQQEYFHHDNSIGISRYLSEPNVYPWRKLLKVLPKQGIDLLPAGPATYNSLDLLDTDAFTKLLEEARQAYDYVLLDLPPTGQTSDFIMVSPKVHFSLYISKHSTVKAADLERINELYKQGDAGRIGLVINQVANPAHFRLGDSEYYGYGRKRKNAYAYS